MWYVTDFQGIKKYDTASVKRIQGSIAIVTVCEQLLMLKMCICHEPITIR